MFGCEALKSATTLSSTSFCSGASPPPRQQYQRISTGPPGGTVAGPLDSAAVLGAVLGAVEPASGGGGGVTALPHAVASRASAITRTPGRNGRASMVSSSYVCRRSAGRCG